MWLVSDRGHDDKVGPAAGDVLPDAGLSVWVRAEVLQRRYHDAGGVLLGKDGQQATQAGGLRFRGWGTPVCEDDAERVVLGPAPCGQCKAHAFGLGNGLLRNPVVAIERRWPGNPTQQPARARICLRQGQ